MNSYWSGEKNKCIYSDFGKIIVNSKWNHEADSESKLILQKKNSVFIAISGIR